MGTAARMSRRGFVLGLLSGCTVAGPEFEKPKIGLPSRFLREESSVARNNTEQWWKAFNDNLLNQLVAYGLENNKDIQRIAARIQQSQGILASSGFPFSGATKVGEAAISGGGGDRPDHTGFARAEATWKLDLYGKLQREKESAFARLEASYADADVWRLLFVDEVITAYMDMRYGQELIRIIQRVLKSREDTLAATLKLQETGGATELEVAQAESLVLRTAAAVPDARVFFVRMVNRIAALAGSTDLVQRDDLDVRAPQPIPSIKVLKTGVPADLVRNRPDIVYAEKKLAEAVALLGVAEADLYPNMSVTGNINLSNGGAGFAPVAGFVRLNFDLPIFDLPVRRGKVETAKGLIAERQAAWEKEVVLAVEEVRNAMYALDQNTKAVTKAEAAEKATARVLDIARKSYTEGNVSFLQVLDAERAHLDTQNALALDRRNRAVDFVDLNVALGGSFAAK
ncbi:multidrug efflux system outer membrane protein [Shimia isoporae]|uniref:Multidrug efflux system outer membrane protein n=1 Tax=Shimia isoporae TaxID=647720 RepID=A0A4R1N1F9_9RHOB|nr:efflux transporter outer membrane subunit [Shimia isoporae]TCK99877.1 multidrug efflux system outer membrane protein [Shimia isoporae]